MLRDALRFQLTRGRGAAFSFATALLHQRGPLVDSLSILERDHFDFLLALVEDAAAETGRTICERRTPSSRTPSKYLSCCIHSRNSAARSWALEPSSISTR